jgi:Ala-tRNA(Pro) deacylase
MEKDIKVPETEQDDTYLKLTSLFNEKNIQYRLFEHEPVKTSEEAAKIRNTSLESGAKAILMNVDSKYFCLMVMSAAFKFNNKLVKKILDTKNVKFASIEDVWSNTKCFNGAVPPFGKLFNIKSYVDKSLIK